MMRKENWFGNAAIEMEVCQMNVQYKVDGLAQLRPLLQNPVPRQLFRQERD
jgi:hypothetical protein